MATEILRPNATGDESAIAGVNDWQQVDEAVADDDTTKITYLGETYARDLYNMQDHTVSGIINSITIYFRCKLFDADRHAKPSQKSGSTVTDGTEVSGSGNFYETFSQTYTTNPATGSAYTWTEIDSLQVGVCLKSKAGGYTTYCTQVYVQVNYTPVILYPSAIASAEAFGTPKLNLKLQPSSIASLEAFGSPKLNLALILTAIASAEAFGTPVVAGPIIVTGIASAEAFGTPNISQAQFIYPSGIVTGEAFGVLTVIPGEVFVEPSAIASLEAFGTAKFVLYLLPSSIASEEAFGSPQLNLFITPQGIVTSEGFGEPTILPGEVFVLPSAIASAEAFGTPKLNLKLQPSGIASLEAFGTPKLNLKLFITAIASAEAFGTPRLGLYLLPSSIASGEAFGTPTILWQLFLLPTAIASAELFGTPNLYVILAGGDGLKLPTDKGQAAIFHE